MMCSAALFFCAKPIDTDGVIDIYPNVKSRKYREENKKRMTLTAR